MLCPSFPCSISKLPGHISAFSTLAKCLCRYGSSRGYERIYLISLIPFCSVYSRKTFHLLFFFSVAYFINYKINTCAVVVHLIPNTHSAMPEVYACALTKQGNICCANSLIWNCCKYRITLERKYWTDRDKLCGS